MTMFFLLQTQLWLERAGEDKELYWYKGTHNVDKNCFSCYKHYRIMMVIMIIRAKKKKNYNDTINDDSGNTISGKNNDDEYYHYNY